MNFFFLNLDEGFSHVFKRIPWKFWEVVELAHGFAKLFQVDFVLFLGLLINPTWFNWLMWTLCDFCDSSQPLIAIPAGISLVSCHNSSAGEKCQLK